MVLRFTCGQFMNILRLLRLLKQSCNLKHLTSALTIRAGDERSVNVYKVLVLEEVMRGNGQSVSNTSNCAYLEASRRK